MGSDHSPTADWRYSHSRIDAAPPFAIQQRGQPAGGAPEAGAAIDWMNEGLAHFEPFGSGRAYQNYPFAGERDYRRAYWGEAFARLLEVKRKYDPDDLFSFPQGIKP